MIFILIRIFPFFIPILYGALLKVVFVLNGQFLWPLAIILFFNFLFFLFIYLKKKKSEVIIYCLHSSLLILTGFVYLLILSSSIYINLIIVVWSLLFFLYLESIFHYFYGTKKVLLLDLKNIMAYINLIAFFLLTAFFINIHIFINFSILLIYLLLIIYTFLLVISRFRVNNVAWAKSIFYSSISALLLVELLIAVLFLSVSFYVLSAILTIMYYILNSLLILSAKGDLTKTTVWQYLIFALVAIVIIAVTSQWL